MTIKLYISLIASIVLFISVLIIGMCKVNDTGLNVIVEENCNTIAISDNLKHCIEGCDYVHNKYEHTHEMANARAVCTSKCRDMFMFNQQEVK